MREHTALTLGCLALLSAACSGTAAPYTSDADRGSTHALVSIERRDVVGTAEPAQNRALATFVRTPPETDPAFVMRVAGVGVELPYPGECTSAQSMREHGASLSNRVELLDAGDVALETPVGRVELAPRAFPAITSLFSGVVYTTRERIAALPAAEAYALSASGGALGVPLAVSAEAPPTLSGVTLDGTPLEQSDAMLHPSGVELRWSRGSARDLIYVVLTADNGHRVTCAFRDEAGHGVLPPTAIPATPAANLSLHRLRIVPITGTASEMGVDAGELRFDFELSATVAVRAR